VRIRGRTPGWTERHSLVAVAALASLAGAGAGLMEAGKQSAMVIATLAIVFVLALAWDGWVGLVIGMGGAGLLAFARQATGTWTPADFGPAAFESAMLIVTGLSAGRVGSLLREMRGASSGAGRDNGGVFGSLGMLPADLALVRLEEEAVRGTAYHRPLSLMLLDVSVEAPDLDASGHEEVFRAAARVTETMLRDLDIPFQFAPHRIGAIFPEADVTAATIATGRIFEAILTADFIDRGSGRRRSLASAMAARVAVVTLGPSLPTAGELLDAAITALDSPAPDAR